MSHRRIATLVFGSALLLGCSHAAHAPPAPSRESSAATTLSTTPPTLADTQPRDYAGVANVVAYAPRVYSGSVPQGPGGFQTLKAWGVATVISVDGASPDLEAARQAGLRYVHLPIGYDGIEEERALEIARALSLARERGAVYMHCHHGKHRSASAAGAATVALGLSTPPEAMQRMKVSGTSASYPGLFGCVALATPASAARLKALPTEFPEVWAPQGLVKSMVEIEHAFDNLREIGKAGWGSPADHPDLVPAAEAGRLADLLRTMDVEGRQADFQGWARDSHRFASEIEEALVAGDFVATELDGRLERVGKSCRACHAPYRNQ